MARNCTLSRGNGYQLKGDDPGTLSIPANAAITPPWRAVRLTSESGYATQHWRVFNLTFSLKLESLADEWFVSRATLQNDMADVREHLQRYHLTLETRPASWHGVWRRDGDSRLSDRHERWRSRALPSVGGSTR